MNTNFILDTDSYKASHFLQFPEGTDYMVSYSESRGGLFDNTVFFGLQYILKEYFQNPITMEMVKEAGDFFNKHGLPFPKKDWEYIAGEKKGKLPIRIRAVPEGSVIPNHNALFTVESTDPKVFWLPGWIETMLLRVWYPITVATLSYELKNVIRGFLDQTSDSPENEIDFKLHDFGSRGVSSREQAMIGGAAHLINFSGSDTVVGVDMLNRIYESEMSGFSIPASEHSTITSWGQDGEESAYRNMLKNFSKPGGIFACVSDSYDIYNACENLWGGSLKEEIQNSGTTVVIRPDSGVPEEVVPAVMEILEKQFGSETNSKGYRVLNHVRVIQGDGVDWESIPKILSGIVEKGFSASNLAFGMGGALLQKVNRDTQKFAYKCSGVRIHGEFRGVSKNPITDPSKSSKQGILELIKRDGKFLTVRREEIQKSDEICFETIYEDGEIRKTHTLKQIRKRLNG
ncbi:MAG: nicotinate phosphoribosyltransferase [Leptospiraceae bacterium]|nr:nicotinate phosphoribosyltransferase [Leptospiraceae bacterium]MCP5511002.1 nicotinate phosphoribosyltransferase [Leptospiraceae bacterium]